MDSKVPFARGEAPSLEPAAWVMPEGQHSSWVANAGLVGLGPVDRAITQRAQRTDTW